MRINAIINNSLYIKNSYSVNFGRRNQLGENDNFKKQKDIKNVTSSSKYQDMPYETRRVLRSCAFKKIILRHIWYLKDDLKPECLLEELTNLAEETEKEFGHILCGSDKTTIEYFVVSNLLKAIHYFIDDFKKPKRPKNKF